jgi:hypothetical protein
MSSNPYVSPLCRRLAPRLTQAFLCGVSALVLNALQLVSDAAGQPNPLPSPPDVPGKVISDYIFTGDQQSDGTQNPHMTRDWDGLGATTDSLDYTLSLGAVLPPGVGADDVDALANIQDLFFHKVVNDVATLLVSPKIPQDDPPIGGFKEIYFQTASPFGSLRDVWAKNFPTIGDNDPPGDDIPPEGIDGLEMWGGSRDHNIFSVYNDPFDVTGRKVSLFVYNSAFDTSAAYVYNDDIRAAIGAGTFEPEIDLDGLMVFDELADGIFGAGDSILFSVSENLSAGGNYHGGEIWVWDFGSPASFLVHGGVTWDTLNQPALHFGWGGVNPFEINDINALEAIFVVPEPSILALLLVGLIAGIGRSRRP